MNIGKKVNEMAASASNISIIGTNVLREWVCGLS